VNTSTPHVMTLAQTQFKTVNFPGFLSGMIVLPLTAVKISPEICFQHPTLPFLSTQRISPPSSRPPDESLDKTQSKTITFKPTERNDGSHQGRNMHAALQDSGNEFSSG
jgi:hypothetical protein